MLDVMVDLETMGTGPNAAITAIGAVEFDTTSGTLGRTFYNVVDLASAVEQGGQIDASTVMWWLRQSDEARAALGKDAISLPHALQQFAEWIAPCGPGVRVWGNGASFDNVVLGSAYRNAGWPQPWKFWNDRCYRTVKAMYPNILMERSGTHHNALDDAVSQAKHLLAMLRPEPTVLDEKSLTA
jgi:hypothetical protein